MGNVQNCIYRTFAPAQPPQNQPVAPSDEPHTDPALSPQNQPVAPSNEPHTDPALSPQIQPLAPCEEPHTDHALSTQNQPAAPSDEPHTDSALSPKRQPVTPCEDLERELNKLWERVSQEDRPPIDPEVDDRPVWKTVRIFVSSTFSDFHQEREDLVKKVFAELRIWCEERRIHLIDCDLRWGIPANTDTDVTITICMEEIERCYVENKAPYFLNLTCERVGYVPKEDALMKLDKEFRSEHKVLHGLSVTEMEIIYGAYHVNNPNALFLVRDESFLSQLKTELTKDFVEEDAKAKRKLEFLKEHVRDRFAANGRVKRYTCKYIEGKTVYSAGVGNGRLALELDPSFSHTILKFFKERIEKQYPLTKRNLSEFEEAKYHHDAFMESREKMVFGRKGVITEIIDYVGEKSTTPPNLLLGEAGTGKSSIMARVASQFKERHKGDGRWICFYHFVGAVPNSGSLLLMLRRLLHEIGFGENLPSSLDKALTDVNSELSRNHDEQSIAIFVDALNQLDSDLKTDAMVGWLPETLGRNVHCVVSMITESDAHKSLIGRTISPIESSVPRLKERTRKKIVDQYLGQFKKKLDDDQLTKLLAKKASENCLWVKIACEEMRVFGEFKQVTKLIEELPDSLPALLKHVVCRLEKEADEVLLKSTLCLLEVSKAGLLENELRGLMVDKENLFYRQGDITMNENEHDSILPAGEWAPVYHQLKYFLRPYGDSSEGRLDFYHRTLSKVVREIYLSVDSVEGKSEQSDVETETQRDDNKYKWWHRKLANYFVKCRSAAESMSKPTYVRGVEEYPYHLIELKKLAQTESERDQYRSELATFLSDMRTFKELFRREFSEILLRYWREAGDENYDEMAKAYAFGLRKMEADKVKTEELDEQYRFVIRLLMQAQKGREGLELIDKCQELVNMSPDESERKQKLIDVLSLKADIRNRLMPRTQNPDQIPELVSIVKVNEEIIELIQSLEAEKDMRFLTAQRLLQTAYTRGGIAKRCDEDDQSELKAEHLEKSFKEVKEAKRIYQELGDIGQEIETELTLATLYRAKDDTDEQIKIYTNAIARCISIFGPQHHVLCRLNYNLGIAYEDADDLNMAYEHYSRAYDLALIVYGPSHANTVNYQKALEEEQYEEVRAARNK